MRKILLWILFIILVLFSLNGPMGFIFPMWIMVYLFKDRLQRFLDRFPLWVAFISGGLAFGLLTEIFAILQNWNVPPGKRILLHPNPFIDLVMGAFYYLLFIITWYLILGRIKFSKSAVFILSGVFGILTEQGGAIASGIIANPFLGTLTAFLVMSVYGIFPMLAVMLSETRFPERPQPKVWQYPLALFFLFVFWAVYGNIFYKALLSIFPK